MNIYSKCKYGKWKWKWSWYIVISLWMNHLHVSLQVLYFHINLSTDFAAIFASIAVRFRVNLLFQCKNKMRITSIANSIRWIADKPVKYFSDWNFESRCYTGKVARRCELTCAASIVRCPQMTSRMSVLVGKMRLQIHSLLVNWLMPANTHLASVVSFAQMCSPMINQITGISEIFAANIASMWFLARVS